MTTLGAAARPGLESQRERWPAFALIVGGLVTALLLDPVGPLAFPYLPLALGLTSLAAAAAAGRDRPLWASGALLTVFGLEAALTLQNHVQGVPLAPGELLAAGLGILVVAILQRAGFAADLLTVGLTVAGLGLAYYAADKDWASGLFVKAWFYGVLMIAYGVVELRPRTVTSATGRPVA